MVAYPKGIEIERLLNLVRGFGWESIKEEVIGDELHVTIKKKFLKPEEVPAAAAPE